jgi:hypothetical protein
MDLATEDLDPDSSLTAGTFDFADRLAEMLALTDGLLSQHRSSDLADLHV